MLTKIEFREAPKARRCRVRASLFRNFSSLFSVCPFDFYFSPPLCSVLYIHIQYSVSERYRKNVSKSPQRRGPSPCHFEFGRKLVAAPFLPEYLDLVPTSDDPLSPVQLCSRGIANFYPRSAVAPIASRSVLAQVNLECEFPPLLILVSSLILSNGLQPFRVSFVHVFTYFHDKLFLLSFTLVRSHLHLIPIEQSPFAHLSLQHSQQPPPHTVVQ